MTDAVDVVFRVKTQQAILSDQQLTENQLPMRQWRMEIVMLDKDGAEVPAGIVSHVVYHLHPTFAKPKRKVNEPPFRLEEVGWGEFELHIVLTLKEHGGTVKIVHDLSFSEDAYAVDFEVSVPYTQNPSLRALLTTSFDLEDDKVDLVTKNGGDLPKWVKDIGKMDEDAIQLFLKKVLANPAVKSYVNKKPKNEEIVLCLSELPDVLISNLGLFMNKNEQLKEK